MKRFQLFLYASQLHLLKNLAHDSGKSIAEHIRLAIDCYLTSLKAMKGEK